MHAVVERSTCQSRQLALVTVRKGDDDSVGGEVLESRKRVGRETGLGLFAISQDRRPGLLEAIYGVTKCLGVCVVQHITSDFVRLIGGDGLNQPRRTWDAANWFGWNHIGIVSEPGLRDLNRKVELVSRSAALHTRK